MWTLSAPNALRLTGITEKCSRRTISEDKQNVWLDKPKPTHLTWLDNGVRTEAEYMKAACGSAIVCEGLLVYTVIYFYILLSPDINLNCPEKRKFLSKSLKRILKHSN